jgi:SAM-dependent methyltransferase
MGRPVAQVMHWKGAEWLLRETRESEEHTARMLEALAVQPGDRVCDLGCGVGYLTLPLAERVGAAGEVVAVDIQPEMLVQLEARARAAGASSIRTVLGTEADPKLEPGSCDLVLMVDVYHELGYPEQVLAAVERALAPGGRLVLVEFRAEDPEVPIKPEHKMSRAQVERELAANGWRLAASFDELPWQHVLTFQPADGPAQEEESVGFFDSFGEEVRDGAWLYERYCSGCHGMTGAGDGATAKALGVAPRDFVQGGFSFGNTRESLYRTISSGIPGRSVMPSFAGTLNEDERWLVVDHVRTLMPPEAEEDTRASVLEVRDRPVVARGKLPQVSVGKPERPRGLLVGLPSGLTFEYDIDDVRLLAVRMGPFADREDWRDRGGGYLQPSGQKVLECKWDNNETCWSIWNGFDMYQSTRSLLRATTVRADRVELEYDLGTKNIHVAHVVEQLRSVPTSSGPAFSRTFSLRCGDEERYLNLYSLGEFAWEEFRVLSSVPGWQCVIATKQDAGALLIALHGEVELQNLGSNWNKGSLRHRAGYVESSSGPLLLGVHAEADQLKTWELIALPTLDQSDERLSELAKELTR